MCNYFLAIPFLFLFPTIALTGCGEDDAPLRGALVHVIGEAFRGTTTRWDEKHQWKAKDYFSDPKVIALCKAIEAKDIKEIDRLVANGADVNAKGKDNMTPLLWAFPENKPDVFKRILEHGADPNVKIAGNFNTTVLHCSVITEFPNYLRYVLQYGGDPNLIDPYGHSPLLMVFGGRTPDKKEAIQLLIDAGADLDYGIDTHETALYASVRAECFPITLQLLKSGASFNYHTTKGNTFVHTFLRMTQNSRAQQREGYAEVLEWFMKNGIDIEGARKEITDWSQGHSLSPERLAEIKKRYADELAAKAAAKEQAVAPER